MRSLCWCSAAVALLLAGCGAAATADPFSYDHEPAARGS